MFDSKIVLVFTVVVLAGNLYLATVRPSAVNSLLTTSYNKPNSGLSFVYIDDELIYEG